MNVFHVLSPVMVVYKGFENSCCCCTVDLAAIVLVERCGCSPSL